MTRERFCTRCIPISLVVLIAVGTLLIGATTGQAASGPSAPAAYSSNGVSASIRAVQPAVSGLFQVHAPRAWMDALDESGQSGKNSVPDFLDSWDAFRARSSSAILKNGYAFTTSDVLRHEILYAGVERASSGGPSSVVVEFNQKVGERLLGDLQISVELDAAGSVGVVSFESYAGPAKGGTKFLPIAILAGEGCNDAGTACVVANGALLEVGYNLTALGKAEKDFAGIQITTPEDYASGTLAPMTLGGDECLQTNAGFALNCNAKDVKVGKVFNVSLVNGDGCDDPEDTATINADVQLVLTSQARYDIGVYLGTDGEQALTGSTCVDFILPITSPGVNLDATSQPGDTCGDIDSAHSPLTLVGQLQGVVVSCADVNENNTVDLPYCVSWRQPGSNEFCDSIDDAFPGSPSKCQCGFTPVTCLCVPDDDCHTATCDGSGQCIQTAKPNGSECSDGNACTADSCQAGVCTSTNSVTCTASDQCHVAGTCDPATGACTDPVRTGPCDDENSCTTGETCTGGVCGGGTGITCNDNNVCTDDSCNQASGCVYTNNTDPCNDGNACSLNDTCSGGTCVGGTGPNCDDNNVCTDDSCNQASGCLYTNNTDPCDDGNACSLNDTCSGGTCVGGAGPNCDDAKECTDDSCDVGSGCTHTNKDLGELCGNAAPADPTCDLQDSCDANGNCVDNIKANGVECRPSDGSPCDPVEVCNGTSKTCGPDVCAGGERPNVSKNLCGT